MMRRDRACIHMEGIQEGGTTIATIPKKERVCLYEEK